LAGLYRKRSNVEWCSEVESLLKQATNIYL
ncbi:MAG: hypothetical protein ACI9YU_001210, partial [Flavobacteriales bacterium]